MKITVFKSKWSDPSLSAPFRKNKSIHDGIYIVRNTFCSNISGLVIFLVCPIYKSTVKGKQ